MKVFLDTNVLVSVLNKEYPLFTFSSRVLSLARGDKFTMYTTPLSLAISFYFSSKKSGEQVAKQKLALIHQHIRIAIVDDTAVESALTNTRIDDFEDGMQYYAAVQSECECIVTENLQDFYFSQVEVLSCEAFLVKYVF